MSARSANSRTAYNFKYFYFLKYPVKRLYGEYFVDVNVIPMDFLPIEGVDIREINSNMYWNYGRKILQAASEITRGSVSCASSAFR